MDLLRFPGEPAWSGELRRLDGMRREMDRLLSGLDGRGTGRMATGVFPAINVSETDETIVVRAELPGVDKERLEITFENGTLTIAGERNEPAEVETRGVHRRERPWGAFRRSFALPMRIDAERVEASHVDGILTVTLPKAAESRPRRIAVGAAG